MADVSLKVAQANVSHLVRLASIGDNNGNVHVGLLKASDGKQHIVKFDAGKKPLTPEMKKSIDDLKTAMRSWQSALKKELEAMRQRGEFGIYNSSAYRDNNFVTLLLDKSDTLSARELRTAVICTPGMSAFPNDGPMKNLKPFSFEATRKALDGSVAYAPTDLSNSVSANVAKRSKLAEFFRGIGRSIMTATHAIKAFFTGKATKSAGWHDTVETFAGAAGTRAPCMGLPKARDRNPYEFDPAAVAASCGLGGRVTLSTMTDLKPDQGTKCIYPSGSPNIRDIKQDPSLEDCWFLSSIASLLHSQGPQAIERLITVSEDQTTATVRLGRDHYTVPLCDVMADGRRAVSNSAPWVRILEQAMAMHVTTNADDTVIAADEARMAFSSGRLGLTSLLGYSPRENSVVQVSYQQLTLQSLKEMMYDKDGKVKGVVVIGSNGGSSGKLASLGTGVSPDHQVAVLSVDEAHHRVTILDPYGHPRHVPESALGNFTAVGASVEDIDELQAELKENPEKLDEVPTRDKDVIAEQRERDGMVAQNQVVELD